MLGFLLEGHIHWDTENTGIQKKKNRKHGDSTDNMGIKGTQIQRTKGHMNTCRDSENTGIRILIT